MRSERESSLCLILSRVRQGAFVLEHLPEVPTVTPAAAGRAFNEVLGLILGWVADAPANGFAAWDAYQFSSACLHARTRWSRSGHSNPISPGSSCSGPILTPSSMVALHRG